MALYINRRLSLPDRELVMTFDRSSGPGGQHVNKASTKVTLRWSIRHSSVLSPEQKARLTSRLAKRLSSHGELVVTSQASRSQSSNIEDARAKLAKLVRSALARQARRIPTRRTRGSIARRIKGKKQKGEKKRLRQKPAPDE